MCSVYCKKWTKDAKRAPTVEDFPVGHPLVTIQKMTAQAARSGRDIDLQEAARVLEDSIPRSGQARDRFFLVLAEFIAAALAGSVIDPGTLL